MRYTFAVLLFVVASLALSAEKRITRINELHLPADTCRAEIIQGAHNVSMELCFAFTLPKKIKSKADATLSVRFSSAPCEVCIVESVHDSGELYENRQLLIECLNAGEVIFSQKLSRGVDLFGGDNYLFIDGHAGKYDIFLGEDKLIYCGSVSLDTVSSVEVTSSSKVEIGYFVVESEMPFPMLAKVDSLESITLASGGDHNPVGVWNYLDRDNEPDFARLGGEYSIAVIPSDVEGEYLIVYLGGAKINPAEWSPGMIKGIMTSTPYQGRYRLKWWDSSMQPIEGEMHAVIDGATLTFGFPLLKSSIRFGL